MVEVPLLEDLWTFETLANFKGLNTEKDSTVTFRNLVLLPPFILNNILAISGRDAPSLACTMDAASQNFENQFHGYEEFILEDH